MASLYKCQSKLLYSDILFVVRSGMCDEDVK